MLNQLEKRANSPNGSPSNISLEPCKDCGTTLENGYLDSLERQIVASISSDYLTQVEELLNEGRHAPAAVCVAQYWRTACVAYVKDRRPQ